MYLLYGKPNGKEYFMRICLFWSKEIADNFADILFKIMSVKWEIHCVHIDDPELPKIFSSLK